MVLISRKVDYAILALVHLMRTSGGSSAREVAEAYGLSRPFVANILKELCQHGFIESHRGINGGYRLVKEPNSVTVDQIVAALDGPFQLMSCARPEENEACGIADICPVKSSLKLVHDRILAVLSSTTLEDLGRSDGCMVPLNLETIAHGNVADLPGQ
jgi:Rrf2 family protein